MGIAREYHSQQVHYFRKGVSLSDLTSGTAVTLGTIPSGAMVVDAYAVVTTAFDSGTSDVLDIGTSGDGDGFATDLDISSVGKKSADELATSDDLVVSADTDLTFAWTGAGTAATAGAMEVVVEFIPDNDA